MKNFIVCAAALACSQALSLAVVTSPVLAVNNSTVNPGGPRTGANGKKFFNIEGIDNNTPSGAFASYGVIDFAIAQQSIAPGEMLSSVNSITLTLTESNSGFTKNGGLAFYLTTDTGTSLEPGSPLIFDNSIEGLGSQLSPNYFLGTGDFVMDGTGTTDTFVFDLNTADPAAAAYVTDLLETGGTMRVIITPTDAGVAATYGGYTNTLQSGPLVSMDYSTTPVPEPTAFALGSLGLVLVLSQARRRRVAWRSGR